jgi:carboxylesterase type B
LFLLVRDGDLISAQPVDVVRRGASATVDLLVGTNSQEMNLYYVPTGVVDLIDSDEKVCASIRGRHPEPEKLVAAYRASRPDAPSGELFSALMTDWMFYIPSMRLAEAHAPHAGGTYLYEFAWPSPAFVGKLAACHGLELGFVFDTLDTPGLTGPNGLAGENPPVELARRVHRAWITFATTGDPGWPPYNAQQRSVMRIDTTWEILTDPRAVERQAWDGVR